MSNGSSERIAEALRTWISTAPAGAKLPSTRALVAQHSASPVTVQQALRLLAAQGLVETRPGAGTFVLAARTARPHDYGWQTSALGTPPRRVHGGPAALRTTPVDTIALHAGYPDRELLPERLVRPALTRAARSDAAVTRPPAAGTAELRAWFAAELSALALPHISAPTANDVVVLPGSQSGLSAVFRALVGEGGTLLIESPTYWGAILAAEQTGVRLIPITSSPNGPDPEELDRAFAQTGARAFYAQPSFANPTGACWSPELSRQVLEVVRERRAFLIEDDWAHDFGITADASPLAAQDENGHVVWLRSLTKSVSPAVRVAGLIARGPARDRIRAEAEAQSLYISGVLQAAALDVVTQPAWRTHLRGLRRELQSRRDLLAGALREHASSVCLDALPHGGLNLWVRVPDSTDLSELTRDCGARGLLIAGGDAWFPAEPTGRFLRLSFAGPDPGAYPEAARILEAALSEQRG
ncbi:PLP-dependent aminotransferase family protein [Brevibacterium salitolerans]|uniref:aminotransferase-like domain-containing protein n=1 Tax=Brevibacterium salitolerans TaxID=1403566 RepID=UPI0031E44D6D